MIHAINRPPITPTPEYPRISTTSTESKRYNKNLAILQN